ncbi:alpha-amylase-like isoform X2 [Daphnia pulicaria]|uniref:alpha-amylase-like isoform X2 n=1 Tax=Daphnia pulicaria TaxID=35523 RepID=UPI001EEC2B80|nr:alpha-amylase-like isoform X2 [Daphnia pulicaria]
MLLFHLLLLVVSTCWSVSGQGGIPTVPCYGQDCSVTQSTTESSTTPSPGTNQRTVVFIYKSTTPGQDMFIRGGIDNTVRPICQDDVNAETSDCAISIEVNSLGVGTHWAKYDAWRVGDTKLDWFGAQVGQGTYNGLPAYGTPLAWTTNKPDQIQHHPLNEWGDAYWMVDFTMDCSETENGWFDVKAYLTEFASGWEADITQSPCTGTGADVQPPYPGTKNHMARCGYINRFSFGNNGCEINAF